MSNRNEFGYPVERGMRGILLGYDACDEFGD
jgi:hypothetical protein